MARTDEKKERIIRVALSLFGQAGYDGTTVEEIAQKAEIAKGTVYLYYTSKDAIYRDLIVEAGKARRAYLSQSPREDGNVRLALARLITQELRFAGGKTLLPAFKQHNRNEGSEFSEEIRRIAEFLTELIG